MGGRGGGGGWGGDRRALGGEGRSLAGVERCVIEKGGVTLAGERGG